MSAKRYYIKERHNPQLGVYWSGCGLLSKTAAKRYEKSLHGFNIMHGYDTAVEYEDRLSELRATGELVQ